MAKHTRDRQMRLVKLLGFLEELPALDVLGEAVAKGEAHGKDSEWHDLLLRIAGDLQTLKNSVSSHKEVLALLDDDKLQRLARFAHAYARRRGC